MSSSGYRIDKLTSSSSSSIQKTSVSKLKRKFDDDTFDANDVHAKLQKIADEEALAAARAEREAEQAADMKDMQQQPSNDDDIELPAEDDLDAILKLVDEAPEVREMDASQLKQLVLRFEKAVNKNVEQRDKFGGQPEKFMESEIALDEAITSLQAISSVPELYPALVATGVVSTILSLLAHDNIDIAYAAVNLIHELTEAETLTEDEASLELVDTLISDNGLRALVKNMDRIVDEKEVSDQKAVYNTLSIFENLMEVRSDIALLLARDTPLLEYLYKRIKVDVTDENRVYCSEILAIVLQSGGDDVRKLVGESDGVKHLVRTLAKYRKTDPTSDEEKEFIENCFDALCAALQTSIDNQSRFAKADGLTLMINMLTRRVYAKFGAIKACDFALTKNTENCEKFVDSKGLKVLFAAFMHGMKKKKDVTQEQEAEEHVIAIMSQLFMHLSDVRYLRLIRKFQEDEYVKVERLIELYAKYLSRLEEAEQKYRKEKGLELHRRPENDEDEYLRRIEAGLFTLQFIALLIGFVSTSGDAKMHDRVIQLLNQQDSSLEQVRKLLQEYHDRLGDATENNNDNIKTVVASLMKLMQ